MKKTFLIILAASTILICLYVIYTNKLDPSSQTNPIEANNSQVNPSNQIYEFQTFNISILIPTGFEIDERMTEINLNREESKIGITNNGTQLTNLKEYLSEFDAKRNLLILESEQTTIGNLPSVKRIVKTNNSTQKSYYIFVNNRVYILSTNSPDLYDELDQIAQSFKYLGE